MPKKYIVRLSEEERSELTAMIDKGRTAAYKIKHANILLAADADGPAWTDEKIAEAYHCRIRTVTNVRQRLVERGLEGAINRKKQDTPSRKQKLDGDGEAMLIALACTKAPEGRSRWTLNLLADRLVELKVVDSICDQTVHRTLKKTKSNPTCGSIG